MADDPCGSVWPHSGHMYSRPDSITAWCPGQGTTALPAWERGAPLGSRTARQIMDAVKGQHVGDNDLPPPWPKPERKATKTTDLSDLPTTARSLAKLCDDWEATSARGPVAGAAGSMPPWRMADSLLLKGRIGRRIFSAQWLEGAKGRLAYKVGYAHGVGPVSSTELRAYLTQDIGPTWLEGFTPIPLKKKGARHG